MSQPPLPATQPYYPPQPQPQIQPQYASRPAATAPGANLIWYIFPGVGALLLAAGVFLPWISASAAGFEVTVNGLGSGTVRGVLGNTTLGAGAGSAGGPRDGIFWLVGAGVLFLLTLTGVLLRSDKIIPTFIVVLGVLAFGFVEYELISFDSRIKEYNLMSNASVPVTIQAGFGIFVGLIGAILALYGGLVLLLSSFCARYLHS